MISREALQGLARCATNAIATKPRDKDPDFCCEVGSGIRLGCSKHSCLHKFSPCIRQFRAPKDHIYIRISPSHPLVPRLNVSGIPEIMLCTPLMLLLLTVCGLLGPYSWLLSVRHQPPTTGASVTYRIRLTSPIRGRWSLIAPLFSLRGFAKEMVPEVSRRLPKESCFANSNTFLFAASAEMRIPVKC